MKEKVLKFIREQSLINIGDNVLVALSGGPDSVCLLHILCSLRDELKIKIGAAHVNHMLRGNDAILDEEFTKEICSGLKVEYYCKRVDIDIISKKNNISHELAGREERYKFFDEISKKHKFDKIAIAHNLNDNAETVLMRMMRGTGLDGLTGIKSKRDNIIIRPILCLNRQEIEHYIKINSIKSCLDKTNLEREYSRNKVRLDVIPYIKENFNEDIIDALNRMSYLLNIDNDYIEIKVSEMFEKYVTYKNGDLIISKDIFCEHKAIISRVIKKSVMIVSNSVVNFEYKHISEVENLAKYQTGKKIDLPNGIYAENVYGDIVLKPKNNIVKIHSQNMVFRKEDIFEQEKEFCDYFIKFEKILNKNNKQISNNDLIKYFDYDKIREDIQIRNRLAGDKFRPLGMNGRKKLKDIFIDLKVPREEREYIPLICFDNEIAWIVGYKVSETYKVTRQTKYILKISINRKEY